MSSLLAAALLCLLLGLGSFVLRGLPAAQVADREADDLRARQAALQQTLLETRPVAWQRIFLLETRARESAARVDQRLSLLLDPLDPLPVPALADVLTRTSLPSLAEGEPLRAQLLAAASGSPADSRALALVLDLLVSRDVFDLEQLELLPPRPLDGLPELTSRQVELTAVCELPAALAVLELLVPRPGSPVPAVAAASLRRVLPGLWPSDPTGLTSPPVRLWLKVDLISRDGSARP